MCRLLPALLLLALTRLSLLAAPAWPTLDPAEFSQTAPLVDAEAGAEVLVREIRVDGSDYFQTIYEHFVRVRVYDQRGIERLSKIDLPYAPGRKILGLEARTLKPDGTVIVLGKKEVYEREIARVGSFRQRVKSFAPPALEPGDIVEYRYREVLSQFVFFHVLSFQGDLPARVVRFHVRVLRVPGLMWRSIGFNCPVAEATTDKAGYVLYERTNLPAWEDEPYQMPKIHLQPTVLFFLREEHLPNPEQYWQEVAADWHRESQKRSKVTKAITAAVGALLTPTDTEEQKLQKIHEFCRTQITHRALATAAPGTTYPTNHSADDTLKRRSGWPKDVDELFIALARAAGFEAQPARMNDRNFILYNSAALDPFYITDAAVAVRTKNGEWQYTQPGTDPYLPFGLVAWRNTNTAVLVAAPKQAATRVVPGTPSNLTVGRREGRFELNAEGTLEGRVVLTFTGYFAAGRRQQGREKTESERVNDLRDEMRELMPTAELEEVQFENWEQVQAPLVVTFRLRVPEYADRTGSRLFVQPAVFEKNAKPLFRQAERRTEMLFHHRYEETDDIVIQHPAGYAVEAGSAPAPVDMLGVGEFDNAFEYARSRREIIFRRKHVMEAILIERSHYPTLKSIFDRINAADQHTLTLRRIEATSGDAAGAAGAAPATAMAASGQAGMP